MAYKAISQPVYDRVLDDIVSVVKSIWVDDVQEWETKKGRSLEKQSHNNKVKFVVKVVRKHNLKYSEWNKYSSKYFKKNSLTPYQFRAFFWGIGDMFKDPALLIEK